MLINAMIAAATQDNQESPGLVETFVAGLWLIIPTAVLIAILASRWEQATPMSRRKPRRTSHTLEALIQLGGDVTGLQVLEYLLGLGFRVSPLNLFPVIDGLVEEGLVIRSIEEVSGDLEEAAARMRQRLMITQQGRRWLADNPAVDGVGWRTRR